MAEPRANGVDVHPSAEQVRCRRMPANRVRADPFCRQRGHFDLDLADVAFDQGVNAETSNGMTAAIEKNARLWLRRARDLARVCTPKVAQPPAAGGGDKALPIYTLAAAALRPGWVSFGARRWVRLAARRGASGERFAMRSLSSPRVLGHRGQWRSLPPLPRIFTGQPVKSSSLTSGCAASWARVPELERNSGGA